MAEQTIIGSALVDRQCRKIVLSVLKEDFFTNKTLKKIFLYLKENNENFDGEEIDSFAIFLHTKIELFVIEKIKEDILTEANLIKLLEIELDKRKKIKRIKEIIEELKNEQNFKINRR